MKIPTRITLQGRRVTVRRVIVWEMSFRSPQRSRSLRHADFLGAYEGALVKQARQSALEERVKAVLADKEDDG